LNQFKEGYLKGVEDVKKCIERVTIKHSQRWDNVEVSWVLEKIYTEIYDLKPTKEK